jgi:hypothetical protein
MIAFLPRPVLHFARSPDRRHQSAATYFSNSGYCMKAVKPYGAIVFVTINCLEQCKKVIELNDEYSKKK